MEKKLFEQEKHRQAALAIAAHLFKCQLTTAAEHRKLKAAILCRYHPSAGWHGKSATVLPGRQKAGKSTERRS